MKGILIDTDGKVEVRDFDAPLYKTIGEAVKGYIEIVHPMNLQHPYVMIVNEEGLLMNLELNPAGSYLYGFFKHGAPIVGNAVLMKSGFNKYGEPDIVGLEEADVAHLLAYLKHIMVKEA